MKWVFRFEKKRILYFFFLLLLQIILAFIYSLTQFVLSFIFLDVCWFLGFFGANCCPCLSWLLDNSRCSANDFSPIPSKRILKARWIQLTWSVNLPLLLIFPPGCSQIKRYTEPESQTINFCMRNYMHFIALCCRLVSVMTTITLRNARTPATGRQKLSGVKFCFWNSAAEFQFLRPWW